MGKYLLLYSGGAGMLETEEEQQAEIQRWGEWYAKLGAAVVDGGAPFSPLVKTVTADGQVHDGTDGAQATGYTIITAGSLEEAARLADGCPVLRTGGAVTVYETFNVM